MNRNAHAPRRTASRGVANVCLAGMALALLLGAIGAARPQRPALAEGSAPVAPAHVPASSNEGFAYVESFLPPEARVDDVDRSLLGEDQNGVRWVLQSTPTDQTLRGIDFVSTTHGWAGGGERDQDCVILRTRNAGITWQGLPCPFGRRIEDVSFVSETRGWVVGRDGLIARTDDGGDSWVVERSPRSDTLTGIDMLNDEMGWISTRAGRILRREGGEWRSERGEDGVGIFDVHFAGPFNGWAVGSEGLIIHSNNGGDEWSRQSAGTDQRFLGVHFVDGRRGWIVGSDIRHTNNGGISWSRQSDSDKTLEDVVFGTDAVGWAVGDEGMILHTPNGGGDWVREAENLTGRGFRAVAAWGASHMWTVASGGLVLHRFDPGVSPPTSIPPTRVPATNTPVPSPTPTFTPSPSPTFTPSPTATPEGPWVSVPPPVVVGSTGLRRIAIRYGNMAASSTPITGSIEGAARFAGGETEFTGTVFPNVVGDGVFPLTLVPVEGAAEGDPFTLTVQVNGGRVEAEGRIGWQARFPLAWKLR